MTPFLRRSARLPLAAWGCLTADRSPGIHFLLYHRVTGDLPLQLDLPFALFRRQMRFLKRTARVIAYDEAVERLRRQRGAERDCFVLTFDDGYEDLYTRAYPVLRELGLPFTAFVSAGFVEERTPCVLSAPPPRPVPPVRWEMLGEMLTSGLLTLGAHGYLHRELPRCTREERERELLLPRELFRARLGMLPRHFAYPRAAWDEPSAARVREIYETAALGGWGKVRPAAFDPYRIARVPVLRRDGWLFFRAKTSGWLEGERRLYPAPRRGAGR